MAITFLSDQDREVNHKNGDKHDNRLHNLEWMSSSRNKTHALDTGLRTNYNENHHNARLSSADVHKIRQRYREENDPQWKIAEDYGLSQQHVSDIITGRKWNRLE